jgi:tRNA A37 threonylcarbamoyladenosine synthetase subunit TsaC/SUA5/YrdC
MVISDPEEIYEKFGKSISVIFSDGISASDPSTVLKFEDDAVTVLRYGKGNVSFLE